MSHLTKLSLLAIISFLYTTQLKAQTSTMKIGRMTCEYADNPIGIDVESPGLSWELIDEQTHGQHQTGYQVLVSTSSSLLQRNIGNLWNSGHVESAQSSLILYAGSKLRSDQVCYWKVRCFDKNKNVTTWSPVKKFSIGLLNDADWRGSWIKHPEAPAKDHIWYRKTFKLSQAVTQAFIHVASVGYHELYINGVKADDRVLAPSLTRLDKRVLYVTYDIASLLQKGTNTIAIWYGPGWSRYKYFKDKTQPALRVQLNGKLKGGAAFQQQTDKSWHCMISSSSNTGSAEWRDNGGECIDARRFITDWNTSDFNDKLWPQAKEINLAVALSPQMIPPTRIIETLPARSVRDTLQGVYKVDMGKNYTGWIAIHFRDMKSGDTVKIQVADDSQTKQDFGQLNLYVCKGSDSETFCNRFNYIAGRYINISGLKHKPDLKDVTGYALATDIRRVGKFDSSSELLNRIYATDLWTFTANTIEGFTSDCPHRERLGYGEEAFATAWAIGLPNYESGSFYAKWVRDWADVQEKNGWIHHTAPQINEHAGGPMWSSAGMNIAWADYQVYADKRVLEATYESGKKWLGYLRMNYRDGILQSYSEKMNFLGDWATAEGQKNYGNSPEALFFNNCVYAMNLGTMASIARTLGKDEDAVVFESQRDSLKKHIQAKFYDQKIHSYSNGLQVPTAFALWQRITPDSLYSEVLQHFQTELRVTHPYLGMGSSGLPVLLNFLIEDQPDDVTVADHLLKTTIPSYGYFLAKGETAWPEYWSGDVPSRIHTCYTGISAWCSKRLAGIRPDPAYPGFKSFLIQPSIVPQLTYAAAEVQSPYGVIKSSWNRTAKQLIFNFFIPVNSSAKVRLPIPTASSPLSGISKLSDLPGVKLLTKNADFAEYLLPSGHYNIKVLTNNK